MHIYKKNFQDQERPFRTRFFNFYFLFFILLFTHDFLEFLMCIAFSQVVIPPVASEWDTFFKLHTFEMYLVPTISMVIHFSTSVYSKLIITCSARPQCLNMTSSIKGKYIWLYAKETSKSVIKFAKLFLEYSDFWYCNTGCPKVECFFWKCYFSKTVAFLLHIHP